LNDGDLLADLDEPACGSRRGQVLSEHRTRGRAVGVGSCNIPAETLLGEPLGTLSSFDGF
jgi:hypothetical protein